jgi:hypothetical protein
MISTSDLEKFSVYPFMHVVPPNVTYEEGLKRMQFEIIFADLPRDKEDKTDYQKEVLSDLQKIAEDLIAVITNNDILFGDLISCENASITPFLEEYKHTLTGWKLSFDLIVPYYWDACDVPAEWNTFVTNSQNGTSTILQFIESLNLDSNGNVSLDNDEESPLPNMYYGTDAEGIKGWQLLGPQGLTCEDLPECETIIDIEQSITNVEDDVNTLQTEIGLKANSADISAVGFSNDYNDLDNLPTIPSATSELTNDSGYITLAEVPAQINSDWNSTSGASEILNKPTIPDAQVNSDWNATSGVSEILNKPSIPDATSDLINDSGFITINDVPAQVNADWNATSGVAEILNKPSGLPTSLVNHEVKLGTTMTKGTAVYVSSADGTNMVVSPASNTTESTSSKTMGLLMTGGNTNAKVQVVTEGLLSGLNTSSATIGDPVWLGNNGGLLYGVTNKPVAPLHMVFIGIVTRVNTNNGEIFVKVQNGFEIDELHNVATAQSKTTPIDADAVLLYDSADANGLWKKLSWSNIKATLKTYFDSLYQFTLSTATATTQSLVPLAHATYEIGSTGLYYAIAFIQVIRTNTIRMVSNAGGTSFQDASANVLMKLIGTTGNLLIGTTTDITSSKLTIDSTTQGVLIPRMTTTQKNAITSPANGLILYDTTLNDLQIYKNGSWSSYQPNLVSGTNIKTINGTSVLGSGDITISASTSAIDNGKNGFSFFTDFYDNWYNTTVLNSNTLTLSQGSGGSIGLPSNFPQNTSLNQQGIVQYVTNSFTPTAFVYHVSSGYQLQYQGLGGGVWNFETSIQIYLASGSTQRYRTIHGFGSVQNGANEDYGVFFTYDEGGTANGTIASPNWQCVTTAGGAIRTLTTTSVPVTFTTTWIKLRIQVNANASSVAFLINGTLVATHTTNIPKAPNFGTYIKQGINSVTGNNAKRFFADYIGYENIFTTPKV